jgi:hypothetical protein
MFTRNRRLQRLVAALLVALVAVSAQAWASHVDWPAMPAGGEHAHVDVSALDGAQSVDDSRAAQTNQSDHCPHGAAHLVGLRSHAESMDLDGQAQHRGEHRNRYESITHPPLMIPPIV